jgi:hypothetical protein
MPAGRGGPSETQSDPTDLYNGVAVGDIAGTDYAAVQFEVTLTPTLEVLLYDVAVSDMAQVFQDSPDHFTLTAGKSYRIGYGGVTWYLTSNTWDVPGELNGLIKTATGIKAGGNNGQGTFVVTLTNQQTGEIVSKTISVTIVGGSDGGKG